MIGKLYVGVMGFVILFTLYYQFIITQNFNFFEAFQLFLNVGLLIGGYSYFYKKFVFEAKKWVLFYKILIGNVFLNILIAIMPSSYLGDFSLRNGGFWVNIFAYLLVLCFFVPLYYGIYKLGQSSTKNKRVRK